MADMMTLREPAIELLRSGGPKHGEKLTGEILAKGLASSSSTTPAASPNRHRKHGGLSMSYCTPGPDQRGATS